MDMGTLVQAICRIWVIGYAGTDVMMNRCYAGGGYAGTGVRQDVGTLIQNITGQDDRFQMFSYMDLNPMFLSSSA